MKIKICGLSRLEDVRAVNAFRPDYCGFIIEFPKSPRSVSLDVLYTLRKALHPDITPVGVFVDRSMEDIAGMAAYAHLPVVQLHGCESNSEIDELRERSNVRIWKAHQIRTAGDIECANLSRADFVLLDAGQGGGTSFDWSLLKSIRRPFGLAGGLNLQNIPQALQTGAELLDVSSGAETGGWKNPEKIKTIVSMIKGAR